MVSSLDSNVEVKMDYFYVHDTQLGATEDICSTDGYYAKYDFNDDSNPGRITADESTFQIPFQISSLQYQEDGIAGCNPNQFLHISYSIFDFLT